MGIASLHPSYTLPMSPPKVLEVLEAPTQQAAEERSPDERSDIRDLCYRSPHVAALMRATGRQRQ
jgi:hypothetical protein